MEDTICAISTAPGIGAISIIRLSGNNAINIVDSIFSSDLKDVRSHTIHYGHIIIDNEIIDEVLVMVMKAPKTYTKEDIVEINCHGGYNTTNKLFEVILSKGARIADPGEFTKRAYLNGRINLLESEAVNELINANTDSKRRLSLNQMGGQLTKQINSIREELISLMSNIEVNIDYPEYTDNLVITKKILLERLDVISQNLDKLVNGAKYGKIVSNGINIAIVGKPNVGKSSILNYFLDENKAIVTDVAGTTRDIVEGKFSLNGIETTLFDTAGIHDTDDLVEKIGVEKSIYSIENADLVLLILDGSRELDRDDFKLIELCREKKHLIFVNKNDLNLKIKDSKYIYGNTTSSDGLDILKNKIIDCLEINKINKDLTYLSNARQTDLINKASLTLKNGLNAINDGMPIDLIENDLKRCYEFLGQIIGDTYDDDVINALFNNFCVGK